MRNEQNIIPIGSPDDDVRSSDSMSVAFTVVKDGVGQVPSVRSQTFAWKFVD